MVNIAKIDDIIDILMTLRDASEEDDIIGLRAKDLEEIVKGKGIHSGEIGTMFRTTVMKKVVKRIKIGNLVYYKAKGYGE